MATPRILISGGYGRGGSEIARLITEQLPEAGLSIGGRDLQRARSFADRLRAEGGSRGRARPEETPEGVRLDLSDPASLAPALAGVTLLVNAAPPGASDPHTLLDAVLDAGADLIDVTPDPALRSAFFSGPDARFADAGRTAVLGAGFNPGLPSVLARLVAQAAPHATRIRIGSLFSDPELPMAACQDILDEIEIGAPVFRDGAWRSSGLGDIARMDFGARFGPRLTLPVRSPELERLPAELGIQTLALHSTGFNPVADAVVTLSVLLRLGRYRASSSLAARALRWSLGFTSPPFGGALVAEAASGGSTSPEGVLLVSHPELYRATAIAVVGAAQELLDRRMAAGGGFMGHLVDPPAYLAALARLGMGVEGRLAP